jgi:hypothetical protein
VNVVLALILGVFSIIGILGIRDIGQIRKAGIARRNETCSRVATQNPPPVAT